MEQSLHIVCPHCLSVNRLPRQKLNNSAMCGHCKRQLFNGQALQLDSVSYRKVISRTEIPVVVDFWASWCGPCKMMAPVFEQAAARLEPAFRLAKLDIEAEPRIAQQFGIRSVPSLMIFKEGKEHARQAGAMDFTSLVGWIQANA